MATVGVCFVCLCAAFSDAAGGFLRRFSSSLVDVFLFCQRLLLSSSCWGHFLSRETALVCFFSTRFTPMSVEEGWKFARSSDDETLRRRDSVLLSTSAKKLDIQGRSKLKKEPV